MQYTHTATHPHIHTSTQASIQTYRHTDNHRHIDTQKYRQTDRQKDRQIDRPTDRLSDRPTDRQTDRHTHSMPPGRSRTSISKWFLSENHFVSAKSYALPVHFVPPMNSLATALVKPISPANFAAKLSTTQYTESCIKVTEPESKHSPPHPGSNGHARR